jgi:hypothetical protein
MQPEICPRCGSGDVSIAYVPEHWVDHCICNTCLEEWVE